MRCVLVGPLIVLLVLLEAHTISGSSVHRRQASISCNGNRLQYLTMLCRQYPARCLQSPVQKALRSFPLVDGHNDFAVVVRSKCGNSLGAFNFSDQLKYKPGWEDCHTDIPRLREGKVGGQFWSAFTYCKSQFKDAVENTLEQIDVIKRLIKKNPQDLVFTTTADGILQAFQDGKIASLIGVEGGHSIDSRLAVLRMYYELGARYLTLTHTCNTPWATSSTNLGNSSSCSDLSSFGKKVILEMNRLGMMVDLAHVSQNTMYEALKTSVAPVILSHSSAYSVYPHPRNVPDILLKLLKKNRGIIMVTFYPAFTGGVNINAIVAHINHIVNVIGQDNVGLGGDFDGMPSTPVGLEDVSKYPVLLEALFRSNPLRWTQQNLEKLIGRNLVRVFKEVEMVRDKLAFVDPIDDPIAMKELNCVRDSSLRACRTSNEIDEYEYIIKMMNQRLV